MSLNSLIQQSAFNEIATRLRSFIRQQISGIPPRSPSIVEEEFNALALEMFAFQYENISIYRKLAEGLQKSPANVSHWDQIPSVVTSAFKEFDFTSIPESSRSTCFYSSGTTQQTRSRHHHNPETLALYEASLLPWFARHAGLNPGSRRQFLSLTPEAIAAPHSSLAHMFAVIHREFGNDASRFAGSVDGSGNWVLDCTQATETLQALTLKNHPVMLMGTAFNMVHLLDHLGDRQINMQLPAGSCAMETGGYKGRSRELSKSELHREMGARLGLPMGAILCEYGMSEISSQGYDTMLGGETSAARVFQFPPWARVQIISPETGREVEEGERGLIRIFDLANVGSVLAVQTEDVGIRRGEGFELLGRTTRAEPRGCSLQSL